MTTKFQSITRFWAIALLALISTFSILPPLAAAPGNASAKVFRPKNQKATPRAAAGVSIVNAASYLTGLCPGGIASIFGTGLTQITDTEGANTDPLPTQIGDVVVQINGVNAPLYTVAHLNGYDQINLQVPYETPVGLGAVQVDIFNDGLLISSTITDSYTEDPGIFEYPANGISNYAIAVHPDDYSLITTDNPALPGEVIVLYTTGLGPLTVALADGVGAPGDPLAYTVDPYNVQIGPDVLSGTDPNAVLFSGLAPGLVGLYQLNIKIPTDLSAGSYNVQIFTSYANSGIAVLPIG